MKKLTSVKYKLVYALNTHPYLGDIIEPFAVKLNEEFRPTLYSKRIYSHTFESYFDELDSSDLELLKVMDEYSLENLSKKFYKGKLRPVEFFQKKMTNELLNEVLHPYIDKRISKCLDLIYKYNKTLYFKGEFDNVMTEKIEIPEEPATVLFHFNKNEEGTRYYPTIKHQNELVRFCNNGSRIVCETPCWLLNENKLYHFKQAIDGKKLFPFLNKHFIQIPAKSEQTYYSKFVIPLVEQYPVKAEGFKINKVNTSVKPTIVLDREISGKVGWFLFFRYGEKKVKAEDKRKYLAEMLSVNAHYDVNKFIRDEEKESFIKKFLEKEGFLSNDNYFFYLDQTDHSVESAIAKHINWATANSAKLEQLGFEIKQEQFNTQNDYFLGEIDLNLEVKDKSDWFDIYGFVRFGEFKIPFIKLRKNIINEIREYKLPNGQIAVIPEEWFSRFKEMFIFGQKENESILVNKHHYKLLQNTSDTVKGLEEKLKDQLEKLDQKSKVDKLDVPELYNAKLRPYQTAGYRWMNYIGNKGFGVCLADDMGLGKTVQTLCLLLNEKKSHIQKCSNGKGSNTSLLDLFGAIDPLDFSDKGRNTSLIVMPASLIHNWKNEARKFTPQLRVLDYTGIDRHSLIDVIGNFDIVLSTYGTVRNDLDLLNQYEFNYVILDESQIIKNPGAKISKAVRKLNAKKRLTLTGTPIENSLTDLWSQMNFLNPGLLGSFKFFKKNFVYPVEKKNDPEAEERLRKLIEPFILRRTKSEVAKELPSLTEKVYYCEMTEKQKSHYEKVKSSFRNQILDNIEKVGIQKSQFVILKGLIQLRQLSNHPKLLDTDSNIESGKFADVNRMIEHVTNEGHKILVFSQFVKHLDLFKAHFEENGQKYAYLTGSSKNRSEIIKRFTEDEEVKVFLISLKAGGSGLNLTAADYVFMLDPWWNPAAESQAINRAHRIGQDKKVFSYKFITKGSIEEKILALQKKKSRISKSLIQANRNVNRFLGKNDIESLLE